jgi:MFS family permease
LKSVKRSPADKSQEPKDPTGHHSSTPAAQLTLLAVAMVLGMSPWFAATVVAPAMVAEWGVGAGTGTWLTIAVQLGFVIGTLLSALLMLSDRWSARRLACGSAIVAALATAAVMIPGITPAAAIALRAATGAALAGVYPPGMKIAAGWWKAGRGMAIGVLVGALTLGSAAPNLIRAAVPSHDWRLVLLLAAAASVGAGVVFLAFIREGPFQAPSQRFSWRALARITESRGVRLATGGYLGHMWELYAMWSAMGAFWAYVAMRRDLPPGSAPFLAFVCIAAGAAGSVAAGVVADRVGRTRVTIWAMAASGACALLIGTLVHGPLLLLVFVGLLWGATVVADSAQFSALVTELAPPEYVGTALTMQTCLGFLLTTVTIRLVPYWASAWGWERAFVPLVIGPALGIAAMRRLGNGAPRARSLTGGPTKLTTIREIP